MPKDFTADDLDTLSVLDRTLGPGRNAPPAAPPAPDPAPPAPSAVPDPPAPPTPPTPPTPPAPPAPPAPGKSDDPLLESLIALSTPPADPAPPAPSTPPASAAVQLDAHELSPHARPSTAEQFTKVKETARGIITGLEAKVAELQAQLSSQPKPADALTPEIKAELEELRAFRAKAAVPHDPAFRERFVAPVERAEQEIFEILKAEGASDDRLDTVRKTGVLNVDWEPVISATSPPQRARLRALLARHAAATLDRDEAQKSGDAFLKDFAESQSKTRKEQEQRSRAAAVESFEANVSSIPVLNPRPIPPGTPAEVAQHVTNLNSFVAEARTAARAALESGDPRELSALAAAAAASMVYRAQSDALVEVTRQLRGRLAAAEKQLAAVTRAMPPAGAGGPTAPSGGAREKAPTLPFGATAQEAFAHWESTRRNAA